MNQQSTRHIMLIEPGEFYANPETMETNVYQVNEQEAREVTLGRALSEFRGFRDTLVENGVIVTVCKGHKGRPDQLFPNWVSTHEEGMILYPMLNQTRRQERAPEMIDLLGRTYQLLHDMRPRENEGGFLEATGSLCLDRVNRVAYAGLSRRTTAETVREWGRLMDYDVEIFETSSHRGLPVYHTDLVVFIGSKVAGVCASCIAEGDRTRVLDRLGRTHDIVELSAEQQKAFCGNSLEVRGEDDEKMLVMSGQAFSALTDEQKFTYGKYFTRILHAPLPTIEAYGGGSARCLMLELF